MTGGDKPTGQKEGVRGGPVKRGQNRSDGLRAKEKNLKRGFFIAFPADQ